LSEKSDKIFTIDEYFLRRSFTDKVYSIMTVTSLVAVVLPRVGKNIKKCPVFLKEEKVCYKICVLHFTLSQSSEIVFRS